MRILVLCKIFTPRTAEDMNLDQPEKVTKTLLLRVDVTPNIQDVQYLTRALKCLVEIMSEGSPFLLHPDNSVELLDLLVPVRLTEICAGLLHLAYSPAFSTKETRHKQPIVETPIDLIRMTTPASASVSKEDRSWAVKQLNLFLDEVSELCWIC